MTVAVDGDRTQPQIAVLERGLAKIYGNNLVLVGTGPRELGLVCVHLVGHRGAWSDGEGKRGQGAWPPVSGKGAVAHNAAKSSRHCDWPGLLNGNRWRRRGAHDCGKRYYSGAKGSYSVLCCHRAPNSNRAYGRFQPGPIP